MAFLITVLYLIPECTLKLLIATSTGLLVNKKAAQTVMQLHRDEHWDLHVQLLEMAQVAHVKEQIENPVTSSVFKGYLEELYPAIFSEDEMELFEAGWKIHNWNHSRGMNPTELKECMEHLGFDDSEMVIGEWWLVFDSQGTGTLTHEDFVRMSLFHC